MVRIDFDRLQKKMNLSVKGLFEQIVKLIVLIVFRQPDKVFSPLILSVL